MQHTQRRPRGASIKFMTRQTWVSDHAWHIILKFYVPHVASPFTFPRVADLLPTIRRRARQAPARQAPAQMARAKEGSKKRQLDQARATDADADADADCVVTGEGFGTGGVLAGAEDGVVRPGGATKGAGKRQGEKAFAQTQCRGTWGDSEITCAFCYDEGLEHVPYAQRPAFTVHPTLFVGPDYVRDEAKDPKPVLEAARKNASRNKSDNTNLVAGDVLTKKVYSQACGARCTSRCWSHAWPQAAHSPSCLAHVPRVASRRTPRPPPPGARTTRGMHTARAATGRHMCHTWQQRTGPCGACAMRGMHTARSAPWADHVPRVASHRTPPPSARRTCHAWHAHRAPAPLAYHVPRMASRRAPLHPSCTFCPVPGDGATRGLTPRTPGATCLHVLPRACR